MKFSEDYQAMFKRTPKLGEVLLNLFKYSHLRYIFVGRLTESCGDNVIRKLLKFYLKHNTKHSGIEIDFSNGTIGAGLQLLHPFNITVNPGSKLGENVVLFKGCTIGSIRSGKRTGVPIIGNNVVIGCNVMVCGKICIGNNVMIAANSFVNFDVPENSLVIGNPAVIHKKNNPTKDYIDLKGIK